LSQLIKIQTGKKQKLPAIRQALFVSIVSSRCCPGPKFELGSWPYEAPLDAWETKASLMTSLLSPENGKVC
jgi:hypothetical protein